MDMRLVVPQSQSGRFEKRTFLAIVWIRTSILPVGSIIRN